MFNPLFWARERQTRTAVRAGVGGGRYGRGRHFPMVARKNREGCEAGDKTQVPKDIPQELIPFY